MNHIIKQMIYWLSYLIVVLIILSCGGRQDDRPGDEQAAELIMYPTNADHYDTNTNWIVLGGRNLSNSSGGAFNWTNEATGEQGVISITGGAFQQCGYVIYVWTCLEGDSTAWETEAITLTAGENRIVVKMGQYFDTIVVKFTPPAILAIINDPTSASVNVPTTKKISVVFNTLMDAQSLVNDGFVLYDSSWTSVPVTMQYGLCLFPLVRLCEYRFTPIQPLKQGETYKVLVKGTVKDYMGFELGNDIESVFSTGWMIKDMVLPASM